MTAGSQSILMVQFGVGDPNGVVTPLFVGALYLDQTEGEVKIYQSQDLTDSNWVLSGASINSDIESDDTNTTVSANDAAQSLGVQSPDSYVTITTNGLTDSASTDLCVYGGGSDPNGHRVVARAGDLCIVTYDAAPGLWKGSVAGVPSGLVFSVSPSFPLDITTDVNDEFQYEVTGIGGTVRTFRMPATSAIPDLATLEGVISNAIDVGDGSLLSDSILVGDNGTEITFQIVVPGSANNGSVIIEGNGGAAAIGATSPPYTFAGGTVGTWVLVGGIESVVAGTGIEVDDTDPVNPVVSANGVSGITFNTGPVEDGVVSVLAPRLPVMPFNGLIQPMPPLIGFEFTGASTTYELTGHASSVYWLCVGSDHNLWVADPAGAVWRVTTAGVGTQFVYDGTSPKAICSGPDGLIYTTDGNNNVLKIGLDGTLISTINLPSSFIASSVWVGPDGKVWVVDDVAIYSIDMSEVVTRFTPEGLGSNIWGCAGPDGNNWVSGGTKIFAIDTDGNIVATVPLPDSGAVATLCLGPDNNLWATDSRAEVDGFYPSFVWRVTPLGVATPFGPLTGGGGSGAQATGICAGAGGDLWVEDSFGFLYKVTVLGEFTAFPANGGEGICSGPDGGLWMVDYATGGITVFPFTAETGNLKLTGIPSSDPHDPGALWNNSGVVNVSAG